jgi:hypothetical protein
MRELFRARQPALEGDLVGAAVACEGQPARYRRAPAGALTAILGRLGDALAARLATADLVGEREADARRLVEGK